MTVIWTTEHQKIDENSDISVLFTPDKNFISNLRLNSNFEVDYFIGADWLIEGKCALVVEPKIENLDYLTMFLECFSHPDSARAINQTRKDGEKLYDISFDKEPIELKTNNFQITPLIIIHFIKVVQSIVKKGLKKGYISVSKKISGKVKGKILIGDTIKSQLRHQNIAVTHCRYDTFTFNCIENRIIKKALIFVQSYLANSQINFSKIKPILNYCLSAFDQVDSDVDYKSIKHIKTDRFFKDYKQGIYLAEIILKKFGFSIQNTSVNLTKTPPFYINMPLLFEIYVLKQLKEAFGKSILFQFKANYGDVDFLDTTQKIVIDTKYKTTYKNKDINKVINDIRQLSGYSRDKEVLSAFGIINGELFVPDCLIIYPNKNSPIKNIETYDSKEEIDYFLKFYKIGIKLPVIE